jgi:tRNA threonylcarbamoyladenosine biosynthesis protein TsaB
MRVLALDTTTRAGSVAILDGTRTIVVEAGDASRADAERLPTDVLRALAAVSLRSADIDVWAVASGPGSFTGLRIGIAAVQGFALAHAARVVPVSALLALAESARTTVRAGARIGVWTDAHRRDVFSALYRVDDAASDRVGALTELEAPSVEPPQAVWARWLRDDAEPPALAGDGSVLYASISGLPGTATPLLAPFIARLAAACAERGETVSPAGIQPLYVRRPDAEVAREARESVRS